MNYRDSTIKQLEMNTQIELAEQYIELADPEAIRFDGIDMAIIGTDDNGWLVYDYIKMIDAFMQQGMAEDEAIEWIDYNVLPINAGYGFTVVYT